LNKYPKTSFWGSKASPERQRRNPLQYSWILHYVQDDLRGQILSGVYL